MPRSSEFVAPKVPLRSASADSVAVIERDSGEMLGWSSRARLHHVHPGAIYLHLGRSYEVEQLDVQGRRAVVSRFDGDCTRGRRRRPRSTSSGARAALDRGS